jgi:SAM-dependent methyltransferase
MAEPGRALSGSGGHGHYDHYSAEMAGRLDGFYGRVDERLNQTIADWVSGESVLDVGCGFGQTTECLRRRGFAATGTDLLEVCLAAGRQRYPKADLRLAHGEKLEFPGGAYDTVVLKDTIHHLFAEGDLQAFLAEVRRVARRRLVVLDPNPTAILLLARRLIGHHDPVCSPADAVRAVTAAGFRVRHLGYSEVFAFPLSGGFVGPELVPRGARWPGSAILGLDGLLGRLLGALGLGRFLCWRYLLVADLEGAD